MPSTSNVKQRRFHETLVTVQKQEVLYFSACVKARALGWGHVCVCARERVRVGERGCACARVALIILHATRECHIFCGL
jgi:hypothetical protein